MSRSIFPGGGERVSATEHQAELWEAFPRFGKCEVCVVEAQDSAIGRAVRRLLCSNKEIGLAPQGDSGQQTLWTAFHFDEVLTSSMTWDEQDLVTVRAHKELTL